MKETCLPPYSYINIGAGIDAADFAGGTLTPSFATLPQLATETPVSVDVRSALLADLAAGRATSTFRAQFTLAPSLNGIVDRIRILIDQLVPLNLPHMTVTFH